MILLINLVLCIIKEMDFFDRGKALFEFFKMENQSWIKCYQANQILARENAVMKGRLRQLLNERSMHMDENLRLSSELSSASTKLV